MMDDYIATFFSHFDALTFYSHITEVGAAARLMPVPRKLSASCGTCVAFSGAVGVSYSEFEVEAVFARGSAGYKAVWAAE